MHPSRALWAAVSAAAVAATSLPGFITYDDVAGAPYTVTYDNRSFFINGQRTLFSSGCVHYPRSTPLMWQDIFAKARNDGFNMVQTYWFWNAHEHKQGDWSFEFNADVKEYLDTAAEHGLFVNFRIGPYVCAEWNYGGFPVWLGGEANLTTRSSNPQWKALMAGAVSKIVTELRDYFADRGGPIALSQIENEYADWACDGAIGQCDQEYVTWCGDLAQQQGLTIPWEMCNGYNDPRTINACNGNDCTAFIESGGESDQFGRPGDILITKPAMWTENEEWFQAWGQPTSSTVSVTGSTHGRNATDLAYTVARWFARGAAHHNYYMWHGGNHYGRSAGSGVSNWYANGGNLASDALANEPYRSHLQALHWTIVRVAPILLASDPQVFHKVHLEVRDPSTGQWEAGDNSSLAFVYSNAEGYVAFLENSRWNMSQTVRFPSSCACAPPSSTPGQAYTLSNSSVQVVAGNGSVVYDSAAVAPAMWQRVYTPLADNPLSWSTWQDTLLPADSAAVAALAARAAPAAATQVQRQGSPSSTIGTVTTAATPMEQLGLTQDDSEYMLYSRVVTQAELQQLWSGLLAAAGGDQQAALRAASTVPLFIASQTAQAFVAFLGPTYAASAYNTVHSAVLNKATGKFDLSANYTLLLDLSAPLAALQQGGGGSVVLNILSESLGLDNSRGAWVLNGSSLTSKGLFSTVTLAGLDITQGGTWTMTVGLGGEALQVMAAGGDANVSWTPVPGPGSPEVGTPLTWYRTFFTTPSSLLSQLVSPPHSLGGVLPEVRSALLLDIGPSNATLGRGHLYLNGFDLGRYWNILGVGTSSPSQRYYMLPPDLLIPEVQGGNMLTLVDVTQGQGQGGAGLLAPVQLVLSSLVPA